ncbi:MAG: hypothetical protein JNJ43_18745, partial [Anaerolineales bacterium]|nr:hypothetical protein [Anaerolineales bacterium]
MNFKYSKTIQRGICLLLLVVLIIPNGDMNVLAAPGDLTRVSVDSTGAEANGNSRHSQISGDGRFVVFDTFATNLPGGTGGLYLKDIQTGAITLISV